MGSTSDHHLSPLDGGETPAPSDRTTVKRRDRAVYQRETIEAILDEALYAHVGFSVGSEAAPVVVPMLHARIGSELYLHGGHASRIMRTLREGVEVCVSVTLLDGLVLARSAFNHSANYRSVVVYGRPRVVEDLAERARVLDAYTDKLVPGRRPHLRPMTDKEIRATTVVSIPIDEASAKIRTGGPVDDEADHELGIWAGVLPIRQMFGDPVPDPLLDPDVPTPEHVRTIAG